jgi:hypothetical protein
VLKNILDKSKIKNIKRDIGLLKKLNGEKIWKQK